MSIFSFLGDLFTSIFSATRKAWNHIPSTIQSQIKNGSSIINILSQYIGQDPNLTIATLQANISIDVTTLYSTLSTLARYWGLTIPATLPELVLTVQAYLKTLQDSEWDRVLSTGAQVLADVLTGATTPFGIIASVIEFVYNEFIKGGEIKLATLPWPLSNSMQAGNIGSTAPVVADEVPPVAEGIPNA